MVKNVFNKMYEMRIAVIKLLSELLAKITFLQEAPKMEIAKLLWYKELVFY